MKDYSIKEQHRGDVRLLVTEGLRANGLKELVVLAPASEWQATALEMVDGLVQYQITGGKTLRAGETIRHGYWVLKTQQSSDDELEILELAEDGSTYVPGATLALRYWSEQRALCGSCGARFDPPRPDQKIAVSVGVKEGRDAVAGVRYSAPPHMSGWYLTTNRYSGNVRDLIVDHLYHVPAARADLAKYLALPAGFRFEHDSDRQQAYFDEKVATST